MDRRLLVLALGMFALGTDSFVVAGVLPEITRGFDVGIGAAGQMTTIYAVTYAVLAPVIAALAAHVGRKGLLLSGLGVFVVANLGTAIAPPIAPIVLGLNNSATFLGATAAGVVGAVGIDLFGAHRLGYVAAVMVASALIASELAARRIAAAHRGPQFPSAAVAGPGKA